MGSVPHRVPRASSSTWLLLGSAIPASLGLGEVLVEQFMCFQMFLYLFSLRPALLNKVTWPSCGGGRQDTAHGGASEFLMPKTRH